MQDCHLDCTVAPEHLPPSRTRLQFESNKLQIIWVYVDDGTNPWRILRAATSNGGVDTKRSFPRILIKTCSCPRLALEDGSGADLRRYVHSQALGSLPTCYYPE